MPEHYTNNTLSATRWGNKCSRFTQHTVSCGRMGRCLEHAVQELTRAQQRLARNRAREQQQMRLLL